MMRARNIAMRIASDQETINMHHRCRGRECELLAVDGLGQTYTRPIDPIIDLALTGAQQVLVRTDPKVPETFGYVRRIIAAPGLFPPAPSGPGKYPFAKLSDLNPYFQVAAVVRENPLVTLLGVAGVLAGIFFLGRNVGRSQARGGPAATG